MAFLEWLLIFTVSQFAHFTLVFIGFWRGFCVSSATAAFVAAQCGFPLKPSAYSLLNNKQAAHIFWPARGRSGRTKIQGHTQRPCLCHTAWSTRQPVLSQAGAPASKASSNWPDKRQPYSSSESAKAPMTRTAKPAPLPSTMFRTRTGSCNFKVIPGVDYIS